MDSRLERFVVLAQSAKGAAAAHLIQECTSAKGVYVFSELLHHPHIQQLHQEDTHRGHLKLLEVFAYGTLSDYDSTTMPALNASQLDKLRHLTLATLARSRHIVHYEDVYKVLHLQPVSEGNDDQLEDIITEAIYYNVLQARMDQSRRILTIQHVMGRDVRPETMQELLLPLERWMSSIETAQESISRKISEVKAIASREEAEAAMFQEQLELAQRQNSQRKGGSDMDLDQTPESGQTGERRSSKRPLTGKGKAPMRPRHNQ